MPKITFAAYRIRIRRSRTKDYCQLHDVNGSDLFDVTYAFLKSLGAHPFRDDSGKKLVRLDADQVASSDRSIRGRMETGDYGYESEIVDAKRGLTAYRRKTTDAELLPFYFLLWLPSGQDSGIVLLQRFGLLGIRRVFKDYLEQYVRDNCGPFTLELNPLVPEDLIDELVEKGEILRVTYRTKKLPKDIADVFDARRFPDAKGYAEFAIVAKKGYHLLMGRYIKRLIRRPDRVGRLLEISEFEDAQVRVKFRMNGEVRTIDLSDLMKLRSYYDVSDRVVIGWDGHPTPQSIEQTALSLLADLKAQDAQVDHA
jgi:hypothetical protein